MSPQHGAGSHDLFSGRESSPGQTSLSPRQLLRGTSSGHLAVLGLLTVLHYAVVCAFAVVLGRTLAGMVLTGSLRSSMVLVVVGLLALRAGISLVIRDRSDRYAQGRLDLHRSQLTGAVLSLGAIALSRHRAADLASLDTELERLRGVHARYLPSLLSTGVAMTMIPAVMWWLDRVTAMVVLVTVPLVILFLVLVGAATSAAVEAQWRAHLDLAARLGDVTRNLPLIRGFGATATYRAVYEASARRYASVTIRVLRSAFLNGFVLEIAAILSTALAAVWIGVRLVGGEAELAPTLAALILIGEVFAPIRAMGAERHAVLDAVPVLEHLDRVVAEAPPRGGDRVVFAVHGLELTDSAAVVSRPSGLREVTGHRVLCGVTGMMRVGRPTVLRGPTGSGKSALLAAISGHADYSGSIRVAGVERSELDLAGWRRRCCYVPQRPQLIPGTLRDNVRLHVVGADDPELRAVLDRVGLGALVDALPAGLDTQVGEGAVLLSGGEMSRLGLARALVSRADVVLLDEVTAHLDPEAAEAVNSVIGAEFTDRVVVFASHLPAPSGWGTVHLDAAEVAR